MTPKWIWASLLILVGLARSADAHVFAACTGGDDDVKRIRIDEGPRTARGPFYNVPTGKDLSYAIKREKNGHLSWGGKFEGCDFDPNKKTGSCGSEAGSYSFKCQVVE